MHVDFHSDVLRKSVSADVIIPQRTAEKAKSGPYKTLLLLHGLSDDHTMWQRRTAVEYYAMRYDLAVIMPSADRSWYTDALHGQKYFTFISREVPDVMRGFFSGMSDKREDNYVAGLSMGGYGALKIALSFPDRYAGVAAFSSAIGLERWFDPSNPGEFEDFFGSAEKFTGSDNDIYHLAEKSAKSEKKPSVYMWCGTEDSLLSDSRDLSARLVSLGYDVTYRESEGNHSWIYWDKQIEKVLGMWFG